MDKWIWANERGRTTQFAALCELGLQRKKEDHLFKCVDEAMVDELRRIEAQQAIIEEEIEDWKRCLKKADERVDVGCIGIIQWLFERVCN
ncbi:hypothetical protein DY000_02038822 [Brassica cretica]|uniref:Uncharacterized protein n=1 Tax=Brassica cretica TaxID=69181 RepID=A0ABQ7BIB7_BRACR|nr:hypothetical protein DY000_02038822 [Brassica cretica]